MRSRTTAFFVLLMSLSTLPLLAQHEESTTIGGYGELHYNEPDGQPHGTLDLHRFVLFVGHTFTPQLSFESEDGDSVDLRWKMVTPPRAASRVEVVFGDHGGAWRLSPVDPGDAVQTCSVEDSSDGTATLVWAGPRGVRLTHDATGTERTEPYLLLALGTPVE